LFIAIAGRIRLRRVGHGHGQITKDQSAPIGCVKVVGRGRIGFKSYPRYQTKIGPFLGANFRLEGTEFAAMARFGG